MRRLHPGVQAVSHEAMAYQLSRRELLILSLVLVVPIPFFAMTGLAIPLPEIVQRVAASLVPGGALETDTEQRFAVLSQGSIRLAAGEERSAEPQAPRTATRSRPLPSGRGGRPTIAPNPRARRLPAARPQQGKV